MGKDTGFLEYPRKSNRDIPPEERLQNFREFHRPLSEEERREQGARCMNCGVPMCQSAIKLNGMVTGCPLHNMIPEWNDQIYHNHDEHALSRLKKTSNFPEFTGRVCPALCEKACINGLYGDSVTIHDNELFVIETAFQKGYLKPHVPPVRSGKEVAVIGSGPAGLAVADELNHRGHHVTVYERDDRIGGLLMYGIPNMKLDKSVIYRRRKLMEAEGVAFRTGINVGADLSPSDLLTTADAVVLACGAKQARTLPGADPNCIKGICYAVDFLKSTTKSLLDRGLSEEGIWRTEDARETETFLQSDSFLSARDKHVVVVGGGDTGNDCIATALRHGCRSLMALEMMPKPGLLRSADNPWPEWPKVLKTDYGHEEAISRFGTDPRRFETTVKEYHTDDQGNLTEVVLSQVYFRDGQLQLQEGTEETIPCDLLLIAAGFTGCEPYVTDAFGVTRSAKGTVQTADEEHYATNLPGIFTAGDMHRGQSLVVWAISEGRKCAHEVDQFLMGYSNLRES